MVRQDISGNPVPVRLAANGNLTGDGSSTYVYDVENRLVSAGGVSSASLRYDPLGRLYETSGGAAGVTRFLYDGDELVAEYSGSGAMLRRYVHGSGNDDPMAWFEGESIDANVAKLIKTNHQGSVIALTDGQGNLTDINSYDEWGIPAPTNTGRFQYTGQAWIPELRMYYYKARIYSPTLGRFLQTDPIGYDDQVNLYAYVGNDPVNKVDPTGMYECKTKEACDAARKALSDMKSARKFFASKATGSLTARSPKAAAELSKSIRAFGEENDGSGPKFEIGTPENVDDVAQHSEGTITYSPEAHRKLAPGTSVGGVVAHEIGHYRNYMNGQTSSASVMDREILSLANQYLVELGLRKTTLSPYNYMYNFLGSYGTCRLSVTRSACDSDRANALRRHGVE